MPPDQTCSIVGCTSPAVKEEWCWEHNSAFGHVSEIDQLEQEARRVEILLSDEGDGLFQGGVVLLALVLLFGIGILSESCLLFLVSIPILLYLVGGILSGRTEKLKSELNDLMKELGNKRKENEIRQSKERQEGREKRAIEAGYTSWSEQQKSIAAENAAVQRAIVAAERAKAERAAKKKKRLAEENRRKNEFLAAENARKAKVAAERKKEKKEKKKEAKISAFSRRNFQSNHNYPTNAQKESAWKKSGGACIYCKKDYTKLEISFWWRIYPELGVVTACDSCAEADGLSDGDIEEPEKRSRGISQEVKNRVWRRDQGKCTQCGSNEKIEFDHIIPHSEGGSNTYRNIQILCQECNRKKSDNIG